MTAKPVPPLNRMRLNQSDPSDQSQTARWMSSTLSGTILVAGCSQLVRPSAVSKPESALIDLSVEGFWDAVSETIRIAGLRVLAAIVSDWEVQEGGIEVDITAALRPAPPSRGTLRFGPFLPANNNYIALLVPESY